jgi:2-hydroxychromene-2-carboxylate isomerase
MLCMQDGWVAPFSKAVFDAEFARRQDISSEAVLQEILADLGLGASRLLARIAEPEIKERLRVVSAKAQGLGIFGAPTFETADGELFWGDDRLALALDHAKQRT